MNRRIGTKLGLLLLVIVLALSVSSIAIAQSSSSYQLGCWGLVSAGGGSQRISLQSANHMIIGSTGQWSVGASMSQYHSVRGGYMHPAATSVSTASAIEAEQFGGPPSLYLPFVNNFVRVVYVCPY